MSVSFSVRSAAGRYRVEIARGLLRRQLRDDRSIVLCDERFRDQLAGGSRKLVPVRADEGAKSLDAMPAVIAALRGHGATRSTALLAVGGGVVQDVASFAASIYMRGIDWSYVPTTLLGMADSCIGGKSSINAGSYKNLVGTFHAPRAVLIDPVFAGSLSVEQRVAGLCEAAKICYARGPRVFDAYVACRPSFQLGPAALVDVITLSLRAKKWFIEIDEFDRKERQLLNFGHTFGHALESASGFRIAHGVAVGVGMLCALAFGRALGRAYRSSAVAAMEAHLHELLGAVPALDAALREAPVEAAMQAFLADKKHGPDRFTVILPRAGGQLERATFPRDAAHLGRVRATFARLAAGMPR